MILVPPVHSISKAGRRSMNGRSANLIADSETLMLNYIYHFRQHGRFKGDIGWTWMTMGRSISVIV